MVYMGPVDNSNKICYFLYVLSVTTLYMLESVSMSRRPSTHQLTLDVVLHFSSAAQHFEQEQKCFV